MDKLLIANRGEIACRIIRTAKGMGIKTVAVYSEVDRDAPHVLAADEALLIGSAPSAESYLNSNKIISVATKVGADAIHPGYGFLSENAEFAQQVVEAGLIFVGPSPSSIRTMGSKLAAKEAVSTYQIPLVPGSEGAISDVDVAQNFAHSIGFPVLIKASAGGGGKGMRIVHDQNQFAEQLERAQGEATSAFGNGAVFIEKYIAEPKHIEIQILADQHGHIIHLFERDCSIQRRHQKVIEEAPGSTIDADLRQRMGDAAIKVAKACNYVGAGTVEFLLDRDGHFYFLEMNTRLQVEHPVTEMITGLDLVAEQINIARGMPLSLAQEDLEINGHAIELRVYAEDPDADFTPSIGKLSSYQIPVAAGIRVDNGYRQGMDVPIYYDPLLAKLIAYGRTRDEAIMKMLSAIEHFHIQGIKSTLSFGKFALNHHAFRSGAFTTHFIDKYFSTEITSTKNLQEMALAAKVALKIYLNERARIYAPLNGDAGWMHNRQSHKNHSP